MKKVYVKPEIELESFQFTANIAAGCSVTNSADYSCLLDDWGAEYKPNQSDINSCEDPELCYDVPSDGVRVFTS